MRRSRCCRDFRAYVGSLVGLRPAANDGGVVPDRGGIGTRSSQSSRRVWRRQKRSSAPRGPLLASAVLARRRASARLLTHALRRARRMMEERAMVLQMLQQGKVTVDEAERLL